MAEVAIEKEIKMINLSGKKLGRLIVLKDSGKRSKTKNIIWLCLCLCGKLTEVDSYNLRNGHTKSCGCLRKRGYHIIHGDSKKRLYIVWRSMKIRCYLPSHRVFNRYGGRGIEVCQEWKNDYMKFKIWALKNGYQDNLTIDRIDNDGNYEPNNCRWITRSENTKRRYYFNLI